MSKMLTFRMMAFDTQTLPEEILTGYTQTFFNDDLNSKDESAARQDEKTILKWIFNHPVLRMMFFEELSVKTAPRYKLEVGHPIVENPNKKPGDIDVLIWEQECPHEAMALECKRVKVIVDDSGRDKANKVNAIGDGVAQANAVLNLGFHRTYLAVLTVVDGRLRKECNTLFRGSTNETFKRVYEFPQRDKLHKDIGIMFLELIQPTGKDIDRMAAVAIAVDRPPKPREQPVSLNNKISLL